MRTPEEMIEKRAKETPVSMRGLYLRAVTGKSSSKQCIKAFCHECMGWDRKEVERCNTACCPIFKRRPYQRKAKRTPKNIAQTEIPTEIGEDGVDGYGGDGY
jgi:hypothetical protein